MTTKMYNTWWVIAACIIVASIAIASQVQHKWIPMTVALVVTIGVTIVRFRELNKQKQSETRDMRN